MPDYLVLRNLSAVKTASTFESFGPGAAEARAPAAPAPRSPWQNPYVERLIGTLRRECLDHVLILGEWHLRRVLKSYSLYYNERRTHLGLDKDTPVPRPAQPAGTIVSVPILSGLHHCY